MHRTSLLTAGVLLAGAHAFAQSPAEGFAPRAPSAPAPIALPPAPIVGSDTCTTPTLVVGNGPHFYDTTGATTGAEGQSTTNCIFSNLIGFDSDVWFEWVAPATGMFELTTCGLTVNETKIAVYAGTGTGTSCPPAGGMAAGCNDDITNIAVTGGTLLNPQSRVTFATTAGTHYLIQIGAKPTNPPPPQGPGQFQLDQVVVQPPFTRHDSGPEVVYRLVAPNTDTLWLQAQGDVTTGQLSVTAVKAAAGASFAAGQSGVFDGAPIRLGVWEDPNDDGVPDDAVLLSVFSATVTLANMDLVATYTLPAAVTVNNVFFVGAAYSHGSGMGFPAPFDSSGCAARPGQAYLAGNAGPVDFGNLFANAVAPFALSTTSSVAAMIEAEAVSAVTGTVFCTGDGVAPHTVCPCANHSPAADNEGCLSSLNIGGRLRAIGTASVMNDTVVLQGSQMPNSTVLYFQGTSQQNGGNGSQFGDGLRCAGGVIVRLGTTTNVSGSSTYPFGAALPITVKGMIPGPGTRTYQGWYRNAADFCTPSTFNLTNGLEVVWGP